MHYTQIKTLQDVFTALKLNPEIRPDVSAWPARYHAHKQTEYDVQMAIDAINGGWVADWNDIEQKKYVLWVWVVGNTNRVSGRGLALDGVYCVRTNTSVGPRLVFETKEKAQHFWLNFQPLYEAYYLG